jgi:hypothetical protein
MDYTLIVTRVGREGGGLRKSPRRICPRELGNKEATFH